MAYLVLIAIIVFMYQEAKIFKWQDQSLFQKVFFISFRTKILLLVLFGLIIMTMLDDQRMDILAIFPGMVMAFILPIFLICRRRFLNSVDWQGHSLERMKSDAYGVVLYWLCSVVIISIFIEIVMQVFPLFQSRLGALTISAVLSSVVVFYCIYRASMRFSPRGFLANVGLNRSHQPMWKVILISIAFGLLFAFVSAYIIVERHSQPVTPLAEAIEKTHSSMVFAAFLVVALLMAPLFEEIIFRGYFFHVLRLVMGDRFAIYVISFTFAFLHFGQYWGDWMAIVMVTLLGFALTLLRAWLQTTIASVVMHYVYNVGVTLLAGMLLYFSNPAYFKYQAYYFNLDVVSKERLLKQSIEDQPHWAEAYNDLAWLYTEGRRNLPEALQLVKKAISFDAENVAYLDTKAEVLTQLGELKEATDIRKGLLRKDLSEEMVQYQKTKLDELYGLSASVVIEEGNL